MTEGYHLKESSAMARARELNRTNDKRLSEHIDNMAQAVERKLEKLKVEGQSTLNFLQRLKNSTGRSSMSVKPAETECLQIKTMLEPTRRMTFSRIDYKHKKLQESSYNLVVPTVSPAREGNPLPVRTVHSWTTTAARTLARKKPPQIPRPTGRRRHSVESEQDSSDDDDLTPLRRVKERAGQKRQKALETRRMSLPVICEARKIESKPGSNDATAERSTIRAALTTLKTRSHSVS